MVKKIQPVPIFTDDSKQISRLAEKINEVIKYLNNDVCPKCGNTGRYFDDGGEYECSYCSTSRILKENQIKLSKAINQAVINLNHHHYHKIFDKNGEPNVCEYCKGIVDLVYSLNRSLGIPNIIEKEPSISTRDFFRNFDLSERIKELK